MPDPAVPLVGRFAYAVGTDRWWWSDEMYALHAIPAGAVVPSKDVLLSHVQEDDRASVRASLTATELHGTPTTVWYALLDLTGAPREVVLCGAADDRDGSVVVSGFLVDPGPAERERVDRQVSAGLRQALASHATIDQAKGALMLVYGLDAGTAFDLLRWCSQRQNVRVATLAARLVETVRTGGGLPPRSRALMDEVVFQSFAHDAVPAAHVGPGTLHVTTRVVDGVPTVLARGPLDLATAGSLTAAVEVLGADGGVDRIVIDLRGVSHVGSAGASALASIARRLRTRGGRLSVVVPPDSTLLLAPGLELDIRVSEASPDDAPGVHS